jgi:nucleosome binding factor SPN SPT16 subunit
MKTIKEAPSDFFREGGWGFLQMDDEGGSESESASEFEGSDAGPGASESEVYSSEGSDGGDASSGSGSEDGGGDGSEGSGEDWDKLEEDAKRKDERKRGGRESESDDGDRKRRK